jgi:hypothetical protein
MQTSGTLCTGVSQVLAAKEQAMKGGGCRKDESGKAIGMPKNHTAHNGIRGDNEGKGDIAEQLSWQA